MNSLIAEILDVADDHSEAIPGHMDRVSAHHIYWALEFARCIPGSVEQPDPGADPDGEINFDWHRDRFNNLSVSCSATGKLAYAWTMGNGGRGKGSFDIKDGWPPLFTEIIKKLYE